MGSTFHRIPLLAVVPEFSQQDHPAILIRSECERVPLHHTRAGAREFPAWEWAWSGERRVLTKNLPAAKSNKKPEASPTLPVTQRVGFWLLAAFRAWLFKRNERWLVDGYYR